MRETATSHSKAQRSKSRGKIQYAATQVFSIEQQRGLLTIEESGASKKTQKRDRSPMPSDIMSNNSNLTGLRLKRDNKPSSGAATPAI